MNENINLCEILKGHEGETFYSNAYGKCILINIDNTEYFPIKVKFPYNRVIETYTENGKIIKNIESDIDLFPSKDQRDWNKWDEENNRKTPKTWSEYLNYSKCKITSTINSLLDGEDYFTNSTPIEKSSLAFLKIHQLIEVSYGGNVTNEEWKNDDWKYIIGYYADEEEFSIKSCTHDKSLISFHIKEQAEEFLSYPENVQLLKDYYMLND